MDYNKLFLSIITIVLFFGCNNKFEFYRDQIFIWSGAYNDIYFELNVKYENDSIYSFIHDIELGNSPTMKNSIIDFYKKNNLTYGDNKISLSLESDTTAMLNSNGIIISLSLDTIVENNSDYFKTNAYQADFITRMNNFYGVYKFDYEIRQTQLNTLQSRISE